jgi:hypothetical protein
VNKLRRLGWAEEFGTHGYARDSYRIIVGAPKTNRPLARHKRGCEGNVNMYGKETESAAVHRIYVAEDSD